MRKWVKPFAFLLLSVVSSLCLLKFCAVTANAEAVYTQMSVNDAYDFYGSSIDCVYYSTTGYKHVTLVPSSNRYSYSLQSNPEIYGDNIPSWVNTSTLNYVVYYAVVNDFSNNPSYLGISINPNVNFSNCTALRFCAASYLGSYTTSSQAYDESFIKLFGTSELRYTNTPYIKDNVFPYMYILRGNNSRFRVQPVWCDYTSDTLSTVSMMQVGFNGCRLDGNEIDVYLSCPLVNDTAVPGSGIVTGTASPSTGDVNVNVTVFVDNGPIQTQLDDYLGDNDTGITTYDTYNLSAFPDFDYNALTQTVDAAGVLSRSADGINAIWYVVDGIFSNVPYLVWLCPFAIFLAILSFVLWRKG